MKAKFINTCIKLASLSLIILFLMSCNHDNNDTGYAYMPDMAYSYAFETYGSSPNFSDSITMLTPVEGTIPREMIPYQYEKTFEDQQRAGQELINPFETNKENLTRGKEQYTIYCTMCHGEKGKSDGHLVKSKLFPVQPIALSGDYVKNKPDGEIYHVITMGSLSGLMGAHGSQISPEDRWKIVLYVKNGFKN
jgi:mono/diheme cytochrome c family protein